MSDVDKWLGIIGGVADTNIGRRERGPSRSRRRNQALLGVVGELWRDFEVDRLNQKVDNANIENLFEVARARKDLIQSKKANQQSQYLMDIAGREIDYNDLEALKSSPLGQKAWIKTINSNNQLKEISDLNPEEQLLRSPASFKRNLSRLEREGSDNKALKDLASSVNNLYDSQLKNYQRILLQGQASATDELAPFLQQAQQMKINFDPSNASLLDILSGRVKRNITKQDADFDRFRAEFITQPQLEAKETIAKLKKVSPNNVQQAQEILNGQNREVFQLGIPAQTVALLQAQPNSEKVWDQLNEIITKGGDKLSQEDVNSAANNLISGFLSPNLTDTQYNFAEILAGLRNKKIPEENISLIEDDLRQFAALPTSAALQSRYTTLQEYQNWQSTNKKMLEEAKININKNIKNNKMREQMLQQLNIFEQQISFDIQKAGMDQGGLGSLIRDFSLSAVSPNNPRTVIQSLMDKYNSKGNLINKGSVFEAIANSEGDADEVRQDLEDFSILASDPKNQSLFAAFNIDILNNGIEQYTQTDRVLASMDVKRNLGSNLEYLEQRKIMLENDNLTEQTLQEQEGYIKLQVDLLAAETMNNNRLGVRFVSNENKMAFTLEYLKNNFKQVGDDFFIPSNDSAIALDFKQFLKNVNFETVGSLRFNTKTNETQLTDEAIEIITQNKNDSKKLTLFLNNFINSSDIPAVQQKTLENISIVLEDLGMGDINKLYDMDGNNLILKSNIQVPKQQDISVTQQEINDWKAMTPHRKRMSNEKVREIIKQNKTPWFNAEAWSNRQEAISAARANKDNQS
jgi:hypothetical protein